jgi:hypothetical protein
MLFEVGLLYVFRFIAELKENNSLRPALSDGPASIIYGRREDEEGYFGDNWISLAFNSKSLCLR